ncbi:MAG: serine/threonine-protein phosphatase [Eubacteriales bacterium]|nr:serine/threonine-protein phosphatase [Eubacteriales bacterium]
MTCFASWYWDKGNFREKNEDSFSLQRVLLKGGAAEKCGISKRKREAALLLVCDGIGGLPEGETVSGFAAEKLTEWFYREGIGLLGKRKWRRQVKAGALHALFSLQEQIERMEREEEICCGTTCTMAIVKGRQYLLLHTGDSRAYLIGKKEKRLTQDHHDGRALRRCLGAFGFQEPDAVYGTLKRKEMLLLCTDGFCRLAPEGFFKGCLISRETAAEKSGYYKRLKGMGNFLKAQGEKDNMTAVCYMRSGREQENE